MTEDTVRTPRTRRKRSLGGRFGCLGALVFIGVVVWGIENTERVRAELRLWGTWSDLPLPEDRPPEVPAERRSAGDTAVFDGIEFVWCPAGTFRMGSNDLEELAAPESEVTLAKGFWLGKYEVTKAQWFQAMKTKPWRERIYVKHRGFAASRPTIIRWGCGGFFNGLKIHSIEIRREPALILAGMWDPHTPVTHIKPDEIHQFLEKLNSRGTGRYRLPCEHE